MLSKTVEFLRIADVQPSDEKVRKRQESATALVTQITAKEQRALLLDFLQGVVGGFDAPLFNTQSAAVSLTIARIRDQDATLPGDLKENALELRAVAAIAIGEVIVRQSAKPPEESVLASLAIVSALSTRPSSTNKHLRAVLESLYTASNDVLAVAAEIRRQPGTQALQKLQLLKKPDGDDVWSSMVPVIRSAINEVSSREEVDREEIETLWWMFSGFSEVEQKPLSELSPVVAGFCTGIELAKRALVPPSPAAGAMVQRAVETGRKTSPLAPVPLQDAVKEWTPALIDSLLPSEANSSHVASRYPSLLPLAYACRRLRESSDTPKLDKAFALNAGIPPSRALSPAEWGAQLFREKVLLRLLNGIKEV